MAFLRSYEFVSGQMVNLTKSYFYLHEKAYVAVSHKIRRTTGITQGTFSFIYLGCPVFYDRRKIIYYQELIKKVTRRILSWQNRLLTFGGRYILIRHILQSISIYVLSVMNPQKGVIKQLHKVFARFFWGGDGEIKGKHWVGWSKLCYTKE